MPVSSLALLIASAAFGAAPPPPGCAIKQQPRQHEFDFWIGRWDVTAAGKPAGRSRIEAVGDGCGISEHWSGVSGSDGVSYNAWDPSTGHWHQFWLSNTPGDVLYLEGGLEQKMMVMRGVRANPATGKPQQQRITWTPNDDGSVRQLWETSDDDGKTWATSFDGIYRKSTE